MFKPHVTVACVVHAQGKFLVVEETINGKALWNQPAGHLEADETLVEAARRELWEETGLERDCGPEVARRLVEFRTFEGVEVTADER